MHRAMDFEIEELASTSFETDGPESELSLLMCLFCGEPEFVKLHEIWLPRDFMLEACCEGMHEAAIAFLNDDPRQAACWLDNELGLARMVGHARGARRVIDDCGHLRIDWNLSVDVSIPWREAKAFVKDHHRHCKPPAGWRFGAAAMNGSERIAVVVVGRTVARALDQRRIVEVNRLCVNPDVQPELVWNACSMLYGWARREAKKRGFEHIVTYTLQSEAGTTLEAAGWKKGHTVKGRRWNCKSRPRDDNTPTEDKVFWSSTLVRSPVSALPQPKTKTKTKLRRVASSPTVAPEQARRRDQSVEDLCAEA